MSKRINFNADARNKLKSGVDQIANAVNVTLGAKGRNVIIEREYGAPHITKDGVTVASEIELPDPVENMGANLIKEAASKTVNEAGDGTTTTSVLAQALITEGMAWVQAHRRLLPRLLRQRPVNPMDLKRGIDLGVEAVVKRLDELSVSVSEDEESLKHIATISANNDEYIGGLIAEAMKKVTVDGVIRVEEAKGTETYVDTVDGAQFINGLLSPYFITNPEKAIAEFDNPLILFYGKKIGNTKEILPAIETGLKSGRPLVIIADDFEGEVVATLAQNRIQKGFQIAAVKSPSYGDKRKNFMEDLALLTNATYITEEKGISMDDFTIDMFGTSDKISISPEKTTIIGGAGSKESIELRIKRLKEQADNATQELDEKDLRQRIAKLVGGVAVIYVGANTEVEMKEIKDRIDDALKATKAAVEEGVVAGGGVALLEAMFVLDMVPVENRDQQLGLEILEAALTRPAYQIAENSGVSGRDVVDKLVYDGYPIGYNSKTDVFEDMIEAGILDPKKVTRVALESAASIASMVLTTGATISTIKNN